MEQVAVNPYIHNSKKRKYLSAVGVYVMVFFSMILAYGNGIFLPIAGEEIGGLDIYPLAGTLGGITGVVSVPIFAVLSAKYPHLRRQAMVICFLVAVICMSFRIWAPSMIIIVIPSALIGLEMASGMTFGYALIRDCFGQKQAGILLGFVGSMFGLGGLVAPTLVGALCQYSSWRLVPVVIALGWVLGAILIANGARITKEEAKDITYVTGKIDKLGLVSLGLLMGGLILALSLGHHAPVGSPISTMFFGIAAVGAIMVVLTIRKKKDDAVLPLSAVKDRNTIGMTIANFLSPFDSVGINFFLPVFMMTVLMATPVAAGMSISLYAVLGIFISPIMGRWVGRIGTVKPIIVYFSGIWRILVTVALLIILVPGASIIVIYIVMFCAGLYSCAGGVVAAAGPQIMIHPRVRQQSNAVVQLGQNIGGTLGVAVYASFITTYGLEVGIRYGLVVSLIGAGILLLSGLMMTKPNWKQEHEMEEESGAEQEPEK